MADVAMPRLSDSMEEGTILKWLKSDGDEVKRGDELVEIETDKANMTYEADSDGVLEIVAQEGDSLAVGETIARLGEGGGGSKDGGGGEEAGGEATAESDEDDAKAEGDSNEAEAEAKGDEDEDESKAEGDEDEAKAEAEGDEAEEEAEAESQGD